MPHIDQLKSTISQGGGVAKANLFLVQLPPLGDIRTETLNLLCKSTTLPGRRIMTQERQIGTHNQKIAYGYVVPEVTLTFTLLNDYKVKTYFDNWMELCISQDQSQIQYSTNYTRSLRIFQVEDGIAFPLFNTPLGIPTIPSDISNRLPTIGGILDLSQNEIDVNFFTPDKLVYGTELQDAFPISVNDINLSNENQDAVSELSIEFSYRNWRSITPNLTLF